MPSGERSPERAFTLVEHLEELRHRLGVSALAVLVAVGLSLSHAPWILAWLRRPAEPFLWRFAFFSPTEPVLAYLQVSVLAGLVLAMPVILWQVWAFVRSGLTARERSLGAAFVWWGSVQFLAGSLFAYYVLLPVSLRLLLGIGRAHFEPMISIARYVSFVTTLALWCGVVFELPVVVWLLATVGIVTAEWLRQHRAYAILVLVILAAVITPTTDPVNLILMTLPLIGLYEVSIAMARWAVPRAPSS